MADLMRVMKGLECCLPMTTRNGFADCKQCPYYRKITPDGGIIECCHDLMTDALALLKAQEPVEPKVVDTSSSKLYHSKMFKNHYCGYCGEFLHIVNRKDLFCSHCGKAVKWE